MATRTIWLPKVNYKEARNNIYESLHSHIYTFNLQNINAGFLRTAKLAIPATEAGQKVPVVFHLHGNLKHRDAIQCTAF